MSAPDAAPAPTPAIATGEALEALVAAVRTDLEQAIAHFQAGAAVLVMLAENTRGLNGIAIECNGWQDRAQTMVADIRKKADEVRNDLMGEPRRPAVRVHSNPDREARPA